MYVCVCVCVCEKKKAGTKPRLMTKGESET